MCALYQWLLGVISKHSVPGALFRCFIPVPSLSTAALKSNQMELNTCLLKCKNIIASLFSAFEFFTGQNCSAGLNNERFDALYLSTFRETTVHKIFRSVRDDSSTDTSESELEFIWVSWQDNNASDVFFSRVELHTTGAQVEGIVTTRKESANLHLKQDDHPAPPPNLQACTNIANFPFSALNFLKIVSPLFFINYFFLFSPVRTIFLNIGCGWSLLKRIRQISNRHWAVLPKRPSINVAQH